MLDKNQHMSWLVLKKGRTNTNTFLNANNWIYIIIFCRRRPQRLQTACWAQPPNIAQAGRGRVADACHHGPWPGGPAGGRGGPEAAQETLQTPPTEVGAPADKIWPRIYKYWSIHDDHRKSDWKIQELNLFYNVWKALLLFFSMKNVFQIIRFFLQ